MNADVVVVGAGVIGASCAYHLARAGMGVVVVDREARLGGGSTGRATGGFRAQFATAINIRLSLLAREKLRVFRDETGIDPGFDPVGYLFLATSEMELAALRTANELQQREGLAEARIIGHGDVRAINPAIDRAGVIGGAWCPTDGVLRPLDVTRGYLEAAERLGAEVRWSTPVTALERRGDRIARVVTPSETIAAGIVIDAAGPWAAGVARLVGVDVPVEPLRRQVALSEPTDALPARFPMTIWLHDGFHLRVRDGRVLLLRPTPAAPGFGDDVDPGWLDEIGVLALERVPALAGVAIDRRRSWAGLYEMSPDGHAIVGAAPGYPNLLLANGSSGHGVMHAPALGQLVAELATGAATAVDVHALRPSRFADGEPVVGVSLL